jgi:hypothetical protein
MASPITKIEADKLFPTLRRLNDAGATTAHADWIRSPDNAEWLVAAINERIRQAEEAATKNPFSQTVPELIARLWVENHLGNWGIPSETFIRLERTAPELPSGRDSYRSFRIRWGEGDEGVALTFERHAAAMKRVHLKFWRWDLLLSGKHPYKGEDVERLRLLSGNASHKPVVEWVIIHLDANRTRKSVDAVRGPKSLADEGLVVAWLFPKRVEAIDYDKNSAWLCGGYELNVPEYDGSWRYVPCVDRRRDTGEVYLHARWHDDDNSDYSVPVSGE